jgi:tRNA dimethylallyltransferase
MCSVIADDDTPRAAHTRGVPPTVLAIFGPTGVGKTAVAVALADRLRAEGEDPVAVSADALQVYRGLETLTGAATATERERLEHRLIGFLAPDAPFSAGQYARLAHREIDGLLAAGRRPIVLGGTGLYLRAALAELDLRPPVPDAIRERRRAQLRERGPAALHAELADRAPEAAATVRPTDNQRVVRALELLDAGHRPPAGEQLWTSATRHPTLLAGLTMERDALKRRIDARIEAMLAAGAAEEVRAADARGASPTVRKALGFRELLAGDIDAMRRNTHRYTRRQLTWMRKLPDVRLTDVTDREPDDVAAELHEALRAWRPCGSRSGRPSATTT